MRSSLFRSLSNALPRHVKIDIDRALSLLNPRAAEILRLYFGIRRERSMTLAEIGDRFDMTWERVRQIKKRALDEMRRQHLRNGVLKRSF